jgi:hypothetical protein
VNNRSFGRENLKGVNLSGWQLKSRHRPKQVPKRGAPEERSLSPLELDPDETTSRAALDEGTELSWKPLEQIDHFYSSPGHFWEI